MLRGPMRSTSASRNAGSTISEKSTRRRTFQSVGSAKFPRPVPEAPEVVDQVLDRAAVEAIGMHAHVLFTWCHHMLDMAVEFARVKLHRAEVLKPGSQ